MALLLSACGDDSTPFDTLPEEDAGEVIKEDAGPAPTFPDRGAPTDQGFPEDEGFPDIDAGSFDTGVRDTGVRDTGVRDTGVRDTGVRDNGAFDTGVRDTGPLDTGPAYDPCAASALIDLNAMGTLAGETTSYAGSNASTGRSAPLRPACGAAGAIGHQVAFRYVPRAGVRLRVSTDNAGTAVNLDTVAWAQAACASLPSGNSGLGCDDDSGNDPRGYASVFTTAAAVTAGTPVYIIVAGYDGVATTTPTGAFTLTVTEVFPGMTGAACDPREVTPAPCATGLRCVPTGTSTTVGTCLADGTAGARCRSAGLACDAGLTCSGVVTSTASRCRATVAVGGACDPAGAANVCAVGSHCITASGASTCVAEGSAGGRCRSTGMACDATLVCSGAVISAASRCRGTIAVGAACDVAGTGDPCVTGSTCLTVAGNTTCVADGSLNGRCRAAGLACDAGGACSGAVTSTASRCRAAVAVGGACDAMSLCSSGSACIATSGGMVCVADGAAGGRCRTTGPACDAALACSGLASATTSRCQAAVAVGAACDPARVASLCATGSRCALIMDRWTCVADGARGGLCRAASACDASLTCVAGPPVSSCREPVAAGAACDASAVTQACAAGSSCVARAGQASGSCTATGTLGAECNASRRCNTGLTCSAIGQTGWCRNLVDDGAACDWTGRYQQCPSGSACAPTTGPAGACQARVDETEPNDSPATAAPTVTSSAVIRGSVERGGRDCVAMTVPMGGSLFAEVQLPGTSTCPLDGFDPVVEVYNPAGVLISVEDDSPGRGRCSLLDPTFHPEVRNLAAGRYAVCVRAYDAVLLSNYLLTVAVVR